MLHDRLLDIAHLLEPAILIEYGTGTTYATLKIDTGTEKTAKNKSALSALATLRDPTFIFWASHMRLLYTLIYKDLSSRRCKRTITTRRPCSPAPTACLSYGLRRCAQGSYHRR